MPRTNTNQVFRNGVLVSETTSTVSDAGIEQEEAPDKLRIALALLRTWAGDARTAAELNAMTAGQRITRQAEIEDRFAKLSRAVAYIIRNVGVDD